MTDTTPTPADRPADQLRAAAEKLRALCLAVGDPDHPGEPWHTDQCSDENRGECACIVAQGHTAEGDGPATSLHYIADTEHPDLAAYIALMHPGVGLALAELLSVVERTVDDEGAAFVDLALAVARQLLGTTEGAARCPRCDEDLTGYTEDDRVYRKGDTRPYCSGECVVFAHQRNLPIPDWATDAAPAAPSADLRERIQSAIETYPVAAWTPENLAGRVMRVVEAETAPPAPADRAAVLRQAADHIDHLRATMGAPTVRDCFANGLGHAANDLRRLAADAAAGVQPPTTTRDLTARWDEATGKPTPLCPCGYVPVACDADRGCTPPAAPAAPEEQR